MIGWLLDTNVTAEIIRPGGSERVKSWVGPYHRNYAERTFSRLGQHRGNQT